MKDITQFTNHCPLCGGEADNILDQLDISDGYTWHCEPCDNWFASIEEVEEHIAWILKNTNLSAH